MVIVSAVVAAVACSVGTQYGVKNLVDSLTAGSSQANNVWLAFAFLMSLIAADNLLWRGAGRGAGVPFFRGTRRLLRGVFPPLCGHAPPPFSPPAPRRLAPP